MRTMRNLNKLIKQRRNTFTMYSPSMPIIGDAEYGKAHIQKEITMVI